MIRRGEIRGPITWNCCFFLFIKQTAAVFSCLFTFVGDHPLVFFFRGVEKLEKKKGRAFILHMGRGRGQCFCWFIRRQAEHLQPLRRPWWHRRSRGSSCHAKVAWSTLSPCNYPRSRCPARQLPHQRPVNKKSTV